MPRNPEGSVAPQSAYRFRSGTLAALAKGARAGALCLFSFFSDCWGAMCPASGSVICSTVASPHMQVGELRAVDQLRPSLAFLLPHVLSSSAMQMRHIRPQLNAIGSPIRTRNTTRSGLDTDPFSVRQDTPVRCPSTALRLGCIPPCPPISA